MLLEVVQLALQPVEALLVLPLQQRHLRLQLVELLVFVTKLICMLLLVGRDLLLVVRSLLIQLVLNALVVGASALAQLSDLRLERLILCFE